MSAMIAATVVGVGVSAYSASQGSKASKAAARAQAKSQADANKIAGDQLDFQKQQYQDWQDVYGPIEDNIAEFYKDYDAEHITAMGLQNIEMEFADTQAVLKQEMAQRGMDTSGLNAANLSSMYNSKSIAKAEVRNQAEAQVIEGKSKFLALGLGQEAGLQQGIATAMSNQQNLHTANAKAAGLQAQAGAAGMAAGLQGIGSALGGYAEHQARMAEIPKTKVPTSTGVR